MDIPKVFVNPETKKTHTGFVPFLIAGVLALADLVLVALGKLPYETLAMIVIPIVAFITMASRKNGG